MSSSRVNTSRSVLLLAVLSTALTACGTEAPGRMSGGAVSGAATGATFGLIGGPIGVLVGGAVGGGIGALTAANTSPQQINLGNPPWEKGNAPPPSGTSQPQPLTPVSGTTQGSYGGYPQGSSGGVQSEPLAPPSTQ